MGHGRKSRASVRDIWKDLRSLAYFGMCDCDRQLKRFDEAIEECRTSLTYDPDDSRTHYLMGLTYAIKAQKTKSIEPLAAASQHSGSMLRINPEAPEAGRREKDARQLRPVAAREWKCRATMKFESRVWLLLAVAAGSLPRADSDTAPALLQG